MSAVSVSHSPTRWIPDSPRRKPPATTTTGPILPLKPQPPAQTSPDATSAKPAVTNPDDGGNMKGADGGGGGGPKVSSSGSRISFAPGTTFHDRSHLKSRGASKKVAASFHFRPFTPGEKPQTPKVRFKLPKATLPSFHYLSVSQDDFLDPRYAEDIVKSYGIPRYFFRSKSNLLSSPTQLLQQPPPPDGGGGGVGQTGVSEDEKQKGSTTIEKEADETRPKTSGEPSASPRYSDRLPVVGVANDSLEHRSQSAHFTARQFGRGTDGSDAGPQTQLRTVVPVYKPLIGEKYTHARFFPPMNPFRSLQMESEVTKYVEHKKRVGLGRYVQFVEADNVPSSALMREATMYDLNHQGPAERPLDRLPLPDRKPFIRQRPRDPKNDFVRSADDRNLVIMPREKAATEKSSGVVKDVV